MVADEVVCRHVDRWADRVARRVPAHDPARPVWNRKAFLLELWADCPEYPDAVELTDMYCRAEFDPYRCAECRRSDPTPGDTAHRWSRHWYGGFNPRCRDCRERGSACDVALEWVREDAERQASHP